MDLLLDLLDEDDDCHYKIIFIICAVSAISPATESSRRHMKRKFSCKMMVLGGGGAMLPVTGRLVKGITTKEVLTEMMDC